MIRDPRNRFLRKELENEPAPGASGGGGTNDPETKEKEQASDTGGQTGKKDEAPPEAEAKPSILQLAAASVQSKGALLAGRAEALQKLAAMTTERDGLQAQLTAVTARATAAEGMLAEVEKTLTAAQAEATDVETKAANLIAGMGFDATRLPPAESEESSVAGLQAQLDATADPAKRFTIAAKINELEAKAN